MAKSSPTTTLRYSGPKVSLRGFGKITAGFTTTIPTERAEVLLAQRWWSVAPEATSTKVAKTERGKIVEDAGGDIEDTTEPDEPDEKEVSD